jgi:two-component system response regulator YesN
MGRSQMALAAWRAFGTGDLVAMAEHAAARSRRILLVEDELPLLFFFERALRMAGLTEVVALASFEEARGMLRTTCFDVLVTDVRLGASNGIQLAVRAREMYPEIQLIVFSGFPDDVLRQEAEALGAVFLVKPVSSEELLNLIQGASR